MMKVIRIRLKEVKDDDKDKDNEVKVMIRMMMMGNVKTPERCSTQRRKTGRKPACKGRKARVDRHTGPPPTGRMWAHEHPHTPGVATHSSEWAHEAPRNTRAATH